MSIVIKKNQYYYENIITETNTCKFGLTLNNFVYINCNYDELENGLDNEFIVLLLQRYKALALLYNSYAFFDQIPKYIKKLTIDFNCYDDMNFDNLPDGLLELNILGEAEGCFDMPLNNLPPTLERLYISSIHFNQSLDYLPIGLKSLIILNGAFNQSLDNLPPTLEYLVIHKYIAPMADVVINSKYVINLPPSLKVLHVADFMINKIGRAHV